MTEAAAAATRPANALEASARLADLTSDKAWSGKLIAGDPEAAREFRQLTALKVGVTVEAPAAPVTPPPGPQVNVAAVNARLAELLSDPALSQRLSSGDRAITREFQQLTAQKVAAEDNDVKAAMSGALPESPSTDARMMSDTAKHFREMGIREEVIEQALSEKPITQQEHDTVVNWKAQKMRDPDYVKRYLVGDPEAVKEMTLAAISPSAPIKRKEAS